MRKIAVRSILTGLWVALLTWESPAIKEYVPVKEKIYPRPEKTYAADQSNRFHSAVSQKNLLKLVRQTPFSLPEPSSLNPIPDTVKVLAVRVAFQKEIPEDPTTTGDGTFDFRPFTQFVAEEGHEIDPSPHGKAYFETHLQA